MNRLNISCKATSSSNATEQSASPMGAHAYLRYLARFASRQPRLRAPSDSSLLLAAPSELPALLPYTHPISGHRDRSVEERHLQLWVAALKKPAKQQQQEQELRHQEQQQPGPVSEAAALTPPAAPGGSSSSGLDACQDLLSRNRTVAVSASSSSLEAAAPPAAATTPSIVQPEKAHEPTAAEAAGGDAGSNPRRRSLHVHLSLPHPQLHLHHKHQHHRPPHAPPPSSHSDAQPALSQLPTQDAQPQPEPQTPKSPTAGEAAASHSQPSHRAPLFRVNPHIHAHSHHHHHHHHYGARPPAYMEVYYPFTSHPDLWQHYNEPQAPLHQRDSQQQQQDSPGRGSTGDGPMGQYGLNPILWIEDFDTYAADVAQRHVGVIPDSMLVTASMERFTWHVRQPSSVQQGWSSGDGALGSGDAFGDAKPVHDGSVLAEADGGSAGGVAAFTAPVDMRMAGKVTWVGRSTMEVVVQLITVEPPPASAPCSPSAAAAAAAAATTSAASHDAAAAGLSPPPPPSGGGQLLATAEFVMALRDSSLRRAVEVPPLHPRDPLERLLFRRGNSNNRERQARRERDAAAASHAPAAAAGAVAVAGGKEAQPQPLAVTEVQHTVVAEYKDRNTSGTVFGGHLLRLAYECAEAAAAAFAGGAPCELLWLEEVVIRTPARIGEKLHAVGRVVLTEAEPRGRALRVAVRVERHDNATPTQQILALTLSAAFLVPEPAAEASVAEAALKGVEGFGEGLHCVVPRTAEEAAAVAVAQRRHAAVLASLEGQEEEEEWEEEVDAAGERAVARL